MRIKSLPKITEPDENEVHYSAPIGLDQATLCGKTDFLGETRGEESNKPVSCWACRLIVDHIHNHKKPV